MRRTSSPATFVDDALRDVLYALRGFRRAPLVAFTIVATVALGLGLVAAAFALLNMFLFRVDQVPDVHEMFALERPRTGDGDARQFTRGEFDALRRETDVFAGVFAQVSDIDSRVDGRMMFGTFVTGNAFEVLEVRAAMGRTLAPADDEPFAGRPVMVLSHRGWDRLFARDPAVVGRGLLINGLAFEIVGVMPEGFRGLAAGPPDDFWAPLSMFAHVRPAHRGREAAVGVDIIGRLKPGLSRQSAVAQLAVWNATQPRGSAVDRNTPTITLEPRQGTVRQPLEAVIVTAPLFFAFALILLIACANVSNLLLARGMARQREIGVRLSLGATRFRIVRQLLTESLLLALVAAAAALGISRAVLQAIVDAMTTSMPPDIGDIRLLVPDADWRVMLFLVAGAAVSTMFFGLVPALHATRIEPLRTMRGELVRDGRPGRARNVLIGLQVSASALLLISAAVFLRSAFASTTVDPGMRTSDTVIVQLASEPTRAAVVEAVTAEPSVAAVAASWPDLSVGSRPAAAETAGAKATVTYRFVSPEYFSVLDVAIVRGRAFAAGERTPKLAVAIVSETAARALWPNLEAVGQVVHLAPDPKAERSADEPPLELRTFTVIGVARDVPGFRIAPLPEAVIYVPTSMEARGTVLVARVHGDPDVARQTLLNRLNTIDPSIVQVGALLWVTKMETYFLQLAFWLTVVLGALALALTVSGLFGMISYVVEQRTREIGVRMALGATTRDVTGLVLWQAIRPVGFGLVAGGGSAAALAALLLATPAAGTIGQIVHALDPLAYAASLLIIVVACLAAAAIPAARAARLDPTRTLRQD
jgi:predicted permease